jgi:L-alanine-DL-glutamate epimerase-like enolase superfamily enzyme
LLSRADYAQVLERKAADFVMIDPTWVGGISESVRIAHMAQGYNIPSTMHDCTGPLTLLAGMHINAAVAGCCFQETVRAHIRSFYTQLIEPNVRIEGGYAHLPTGTGLGVRLNPDLFKPGDVGYRVSRL